MAQTQVGHMPVGLVTLSSYKISLVDFEGLVLIMDLTDNKAQ